MEPAAAPEPPVARPLARFAVVDVETNGLTPGRDRVLEVAVVLVDADGTVVDRWRTLVRPPRRRVGRSDLHGIEPRHLERAPRFTEIAPRLLAMLDGTVLAAHNARFDWAFLARELALAGYRVPDPLRLCTLDLSRSLDPERQLSHRLPDVAERHGVAPGVHHDAASDAEVAALLLPVLLREAGVSGEAELRRRLRGHGGSWPTPADRSWWRAARARLAVPPRRRRQPRRSAATAPHRAPAPDTLAGHGPGGAGQGVAA